ncbi:methionine ABC transporter ATP-binding protein [Alsobacter soli]|uniref:Methionine ABC transporter ATP-binding protein n=1 Tax=Alsobacter soli TaxID=2109933 RepID=A0A2T1HMK5_9HYPH|nr:ABC transporter ATP-binding protein [Alsobacter soli]PSC02821.1 methionine ABC transporter ATP-binding protein [Alsobacter soli]
MTERPQPILEVRDLRVRFATSRGEVRAVDGVNLALAPGDTLGLVGESGSGKSVTLRAILRLLRSNATTTGEARWRGQDLLAMPEKRLRALRGREIAMIFQEPMSALNPVIPIGVQIAESLQAHTALDAAGRRRRAIELLDLVGIPSAAQRLAGYPHEFSGGMRQRAMIAIALAAEPKLLLADEPTTALDVTIQDQILKLLLRLSRELGMAMVLVTHDLGVVAETCERVSVMYAGRVVETGPVDRVFTAPGHAYTDALLRSMPHGGVARAPLRPIPGLPPRLDRPLQGCPFTPRCAYAEGRCGAEAPPFAPVAPGQEAACWASDRLARREVPA